MSPDLITQLPRVDALFDYYAERFGKQQTPYRNHVYRLVNLVAAQRPLDEEEREALEIAAFFHDAGIWLAGTFDYLQPSARLAEHYLEEQQLDHHRAIVRAMILNHHKISRYHNDPANLAEVFRRADWMDVSLGLMRFGVPMARFRLIKRSCPNAGSHGRLLKLIWQQLLSQPWLPLPMSRR